MNSDCSADSGSQERLKIPSFVPDDMITYTFITFLDLPASNSASSMLHKCEKHLPQLSKTVMYQAFCEQLARLYPNERCASKSYFLVTWKKNRTLIKARKVPCFTKCSECDLLRAALLHTGTIVTDKKVFIAQRNAHIKCVTDECR